MLQASHIFFNNTLKDKLKYIWLGEPGHFPNPDTVRIAVLQRDL